jgi:hypothetical protein
MDISSVVSWFQFGIWVFALVLWIGRLLRGEIEMHPLVKRIFSSNGLIGVVVIAGLIMSGISLYVSYTVNAIPKALTVNISKYTPEYPAPTRVISGQKFLDQDVPLDGYIYESCEFDNVCFLYDGGAFGLHNSVVKNHWKICAKDQRLNNFSDLEDALKMFSPKIVHIRKTVVVPH